MGDCLFQRCAISSDHTQSVRRVKRAGDSFAGSSQVQEGRTRTGGISNSFRNLMGAEYLQGMVTIGNEPQYSCEADNRFLGERKLNVFANHWTKAAMDCGPVFWRISKNTRKFVLAGRDGKHV